MDRIGMCIIWGLGFLVLSVLIHLVGKPGAHRILETLPDWLVRPRAEGKRPKRQMKAWWAASQRTPIGLVGPA